MQLSRLPDCALNWPRKQLLRKPFPEHLPRERVVIEAPTSCTCCGSDRIVKIGEDVTVTLEVIPRQWKVIQTVREKFTYRSCEKIGQPPAPFHAWTMIEMDCNGVFRVDPAKIVPPNTDRAIVVQKARA